MRRIWILLPGLLALLPRTAAAQTPEFVPVPASVTARGLPPIPQTLAQDLARYGAYRTATFLAWLPGHGMLIRTTTESKPAIFAVETPGATPRRVTEPDDQTTTFVRFDPADEGTAIYRKDSSGGREQYQFFRFTPATGAATLVTDGTTRYGDPVWSRDGHWIAYESSKRNGRMRDLYVMRPSDPVSEKMIAQVDGTWEAGDWLPDGSGVIGVESISEREKKLWLIDIRTQARRLLTPGTTPTFWSQAHVSPDGKFLWAMSDQGSEVPRLWRRPVADGGTWTAMTPADMQVEQFELSPDGRHVAVLFDIQSSSRLDVYDAAPFKRRATGQLAPGQISAVAWRGSSELGFTYNSTRVAGDAFSVDAATGRATRWTTSEAAFDASALPEPEIVHWKSFDGLELSGILYRPPARFTGPRPVMINIHGGPLTRERPRFQGRSNYFLDRLGIAILFPNVRGSDGFGKSFGHLDDGRLRGNVVKDIGAALDWIAKRKDLDKSRVMVTGASYGGYLTLEAALEYGDKLRCAFAAAAVSQIAMFLDSTEVSRQPERRAEYGDERDPKMREYMVSISPVTHASKLRIPLMIAHGALDIRVPVAQANIMADAAAANGAPVWSVIYGNAGHDNLLATRANADFNFYAWILFVQKFLVG